MIKELDYELYIFDLDDTLINTREAYHLAQIKALKNQFPQWSEELLKNRLIVFESHHIFLKKVLNQQTMI